MQRPARVMPKASETAFYKNEEEKPEPARRAGAKKRIALVISHLGPGGAQRVVTNAVDALVARGIDVHLLVFTERADSYPLNPKAARHFWMRGGEGASASALDAGPESDARSAGSSTGEQSGSRTLRLMPTWLAFAYELVRISVWLRRTIREIAPDAVLSFLTQTNILAVLATRRLNTHLVISERNDPRLQRHRPRVEFLRRFFYRFADVVTANSEGVLASLESFVPKEKLAFLPNPLARSLGDKKASLAGLAVVTVGRLVPQKGLDVLLRAWATASPRLPGWRLAMLGGGPLEDELKQMTVALGLVGSVDFMGHVSDPFPILRSAELFVLTSRFEGMPNALLEAMACGLPAIVSDASPGPRELIGTGENAAGLIVPVENADATAEAILRLAGDEPLRRRFGCAARERVAPYDRDRAVDAWLRLLNCG
jgi:glycosyltransferase involved in cell wall biosynthesis